MKTPLHLNLLRPSERVSSSPVRFRVMAPIFALFACVGLVIWWAILVGQLMLTKSMSGRIDQELVQQTNPHQEIIELMAEANELDAQLEQLDCYRKSVRRVGSALGALAEVMPPQVQLVTLSMPPPALPEIAEPSTGYVERTTFSLVGRTPQEQPVLMLMRSLTAEPFTNLLEVCQHPEEGIVSPRVKAFKQDLPKRGEEQRKLVFDIEYLVQERRFTP